ncbi:hypothetical protein [Serpentinicella alkaliphila]|uniref:Transposase n=1 Tax=Serpentinicella alkaliphila TaxID=1734049 RepID=A0A4R2T236_9FIRM|nr:hypothetical protein [Serpentinicella alkaliphila]QUH24486.1 hypothetical protein HZR23_00855 [Serpentinicella alkaliphila]TCP96969.1 hypothetical protein EDD79_104818 [Serpentinicella alkaliphila]
MYPLKYCTCYSEELRKKKEKSISKQVFSESEELDKLTKQYSKRTFACYENAELEIVKTSSIALKKIKYHIVTVNINESTNRKPGRPSNKASAEVFELCYSEQINSQMDNEALEKNLLSQSMFVLCSNDLEIEAEIILKEYKTQGQIEKKFQLLKSPPLVNSFVFKFSKEN